MLKAGGENKIVKRCAIVVWNHARYPYMCMSFCLYLVVAFVVLSGSQMLVATTHKSYLLQVPALLHGAHGVVSSMHDDGRDVTNLFSCVSKINEGW